jgi:hypothetical protein
MSGMDNVKNGFQNHWKAILWGLIPIVILVIIFALPLKIVPLQTTETYVDTEMQQQPYTELETYEESQPYQVTENRMRTVYDSYVNTNGWSYSFNVDDPGTTVTVSMSGGSYYQPYYQQPYYFIYTDNTTPYYPYFPYNTYGYNWWWDPGYYPTSGRNQVTIKVSYPEEVTKFKTVTMTREVTKYHEVPVQVEKERVVTRWVQMSIWQYLFLDQRAKANLPEVQVGG